MQSDPLTAISPADGRYFSKTAELQSLCSEYGLLRYRLFIEIRWLQLLASHSDIREIGPFSEKTIQQLDAFVENFSLDDARRIKALEKASNHDVKATEYFLKEKLKEDDSLKNSAEFVHFACTSDDINNLAYALILQEVRKNCLLPYLEKILTQLKQSARHCATQVMLARTHGQVALPTTVGKEFANFASRLTAQLKAFSAVAIQGKCNGAVGNYNAHRIAYPNIPWPNLTRHFVESLSLCWNPYTTQIEPHDYIAEYCDALKRINTILIDLCADLWGYIALGYFKQKLKIEETGSSTMPHKVNPIHFENAEGNLSLANSLYQHFSSTLGISRWQRDLRDSTLLRNLGVAFAHSLIAYKSLLAGLETIDVDEINLAKDLDQHWEILSEAIQTVLRKHNAVMPYEKLKGLTRGQALDQASLHQLIQELDLPQKDKERLLALTPRNYLGFAIELAQAI